MFDNLVAETSLQETLIEQMRLSDLDEKSRGIAEMIIGNIDDFGYLKASVDELSVSTNIAAEEITRILKVVQTFYPAGVGARDLRECLMLQLERAGRERSIEYRIIRDYMDALGKRRLPEIASGMALSVEVVQAAVDKIGQLEPKP